MDNMDIEDESTLTMIKSLEMLDKENQEKLQLQQASLLEAQRALAQGKAVYLLINKICITHVQRRKDLRIYNWNKSV